MPPFPGKYRVLAAITLENGMSRRTGDVHMVQVREGESKEIEMSVGN